MVVWRFFVAEKILPRSCARRLSTPLKEAWNLLNLLNILPELKSDGLPIYTSAIWVQMPLRRRAPHMVFLHTMVIHRTGFASPLNTRLKKVWQGLLSAHPL